jgi:hypothetical protein
MLNSTKNRLPYSYFNQFCVRTPLFSVDFFYKMTEKEEISDDFLFKQLMNPIVSEAIFLASPSFYRQIIKWSRGEVVDKKKVNKIKHSVIKYLSRMATRCTPFGLFAGCSIGDFKDPEELVLDNLKHYSRHTRYDMHFLAAFSDNISKSKHIQTQLQFFPNSTIYRMGDYYRFIEYSYANKIRQHTLESVNYNPYLENILLKASSGITSKELIAYLISKDFSKEISKNFIQELIDNQILISELELCVTGEESLQQLKLTLKKLKNTKKEQELIEEMQLKLRFLDKKLGNSIDSYYQIETLIKSLNIPYEIQNLFQTDMFPIFNNAILSNNVLNKVSEGISILNKMSSNRKNPDLEAFKTSFNKRFGDRKLPLLTVLDVETGIGYAQKRNSIASSPFLEDIEFVKSDNHFDKKEYTQLQSMLLEKLTSCLSMNKQAIELYDEDFVNYKNNWNKTSDTISTLIEIIVEDDIQKIVINSYEYGAANLLGRFTSGNDKILSLVSDITKSENDFHKKTILAEIVHLPESRTGNILRRPHLRQYEIPCLGKSSLPLENQIPLSDLLIGVENNSITLYSIKHNKKVLPRLTSAHNYKTNALPIYHFLCDLQYQEGEGGFGLNWGSLFNDCQYFPRIVYKNIILSKAIWKLKAKHIERLIKLKSKEGYTIEKINQWRKTIQLPAIVQVVNGDNTLPINFKNKTSILIFLELVKNKKNIVLEEFLFSKKTIISRNKENYCNQILVNLYKNKESTY